MNTLLYPTAVDHEIQRRLRATEEERRRRLARPTPTFQRWATRLHGDRDSL